MSKQRVTSAPRRRGTSKREESTDNPAGEKASLSSRVREGQSQTVSEKKKRSREVGRSRRSFAQKKSFRERTFDAGGSWGARCMRQISRGRKSPLQSKGTLKEISSWGRVLGRLVGAIEEAGWGGAPFIGTAKEDNSHNHERIIRPRRRYIFPGDWKERFSRRERTPS